MWILNNILLIYSIWAEPEPEPEPEEDEANQDPIQDQGEAKVVIVILCEGVRVVIGLILINTVFLLKEDPVI